MTIPRKSLIHYNAQITGSPSSKMELPGSWTAEEEIFITSDLAGLSFKLFSKDHAKMEARSSFMFVHLVV